MVTLCLTKSVWGSYSVPSFKYHVEQSKNVAVGKIVRLENGEFYFLVEESLKGNLIKNSMAVINHNSGIAWYVNAAGGPLRVSKEIFTKRIIEKEFYDRKVVLLGEFKDGLWITTCLDWSVWSSGKSVGYDKYENLSLEELIAVIKTDIKKVPEKSKTPIFHLWGISLNLGFTLNL